ncbi:MAG: DUF3426 domain-containing protein [Syntrophales bacterium]
MIIQCRKCETRFRFDESLIEGDGVWVRCSRCQNVFFEARPSGETASSTPTGEIPSVRISDATRIPDDRFSRADEHLLRTERERGEAPPLHRSEGEEEISAEIRKEPVIEVFEVGMDAEALGGPTAGGGEVDEEDEDEYEEIPEDERGGRRWGRLILKVAALLVFIALVAGGVSLWIFPAFRSQALEWGGPWLRGIPGMEMLLGKETKSRETSLAPVRIKDVRQRSVTNLLVGNLRVIEGVAVNQSSTPLANIRVRLVISDAYDVPLGEKTVFCGNLLTDVELNTLAEAEIQRELSIPQGTDVSNQRIPPNGEIPFMIVFSQEQAGAIKTVVMPAGADRVQ